MPCVIPFFPKRGIARERNCAWQYPMRSSKKYHRDSRLERNWPAILRENHEPAALADTRHNSWCLLFVVEELGAELLYSIRHFVLRYKIAVQFRPSFQRFAKGSLQGEIVFMPYPFSARMFNGKFRIKSLHHASPHSPLSRSAAPAGASCEADRRPSLSSKSSHILLFRWRNMALPCLCENRISCTLEKHRAVADNLDGHSMLLGVRSLRTATFWETAS